MANNKKPVAFISHASEDKHFVLPFAKRLLEQGIDAWVDKWEMAPGDSIVDKIFEEGIKEADVFIIVLSRNSVQKRWVREELNAGIVRRISGQCKIIPVVIDDCEIPEALRSILWVRIKDLENYDEEFNQIVASIYGVSQKPSVGRPPQYAQLMVDTLPGFSQIDVLVLRAACEASLAEGHPFVSTSQLLPMLEEYDIVREQVDESLEILDEQGLIEATREMGSRGISFFKITTYGFETFAKLYLPDFDDLVVRVLVEIINKDLRLNKEVAESLDVPQVLVDYALDVLAARNYVQISKAFGGQTIIVAVTASGKRKASALK